MIQNNKRSITKVMNQLCVCGSTSEGEWRMKKKRVRERKGTKSPALLILQHHVKYVCTIPHRMLYDLL
jgi:hypothetical protein